MDQRLLKLFATDVWNQSSESGRTFDGGVSGLRYLATYGQDQTLPKVDKFVAIAAPFNDFEENNGQSISDELANGPAIASVVIKTTNDLLAMCQPLHKSC